MQPSNEYLFRLWGEALALCYRAAPGYEARLTPCASLVLSGEPVADLNYAIVDAGPQAEERLRQFAQVIRSRRVPALFLLTAEVASRLTPVVRELGLQLAGRFPSMVCRPVSPSFQEGNFDTVRVENEADLKEANALVASAFGVPVESLDRTFDPAFLHGPGVDLFLARQGGRAVSTVQTTRAGPIVGLWCMATAPDQQRKGAGRALLDHVMAYHCERRAELFYLGATPAGKPLYAKVGFETVSEAEVWALQEPVSSIQETEAGSQNPRLHSEY